MTKNNRTKYDAGKLPAQERVRILTNRLRNLEEGCGEFTALNRAKAIAEAARALASARQETSEGE